MNAIRGTVRPWVLVALFGWMIVVGIPVIFRGGSVTNASLCIDDPTCGDLPWTTIWLVSVFVILAIDFVTRKRSGI